MTLAPAAPELLTDRLRLRRWRSEDEAPIAALTADPEVTRYLTPAAGPFVPRFEAHWERYGFGLWAVEPRTPMVVPDGPSLAGCLGFVGIALPTFMPRLAHRPEVGWRLARAAWGQGVATEAAVAARDHALGPMGIDSLISIIHPGNERSKRVAMKLGMAVGERVRSALLGITLEIWSTEEPGRVQAARAAVRAAAERAGGRR